MAASYNRSTVCCNNFYLPLLVVAMLWSSPGSEAALTLNLNLSLDLCKKADYPALCRSVVKGLTDPSTAMETSIKKLMVETKQAMSVAKRQKSSAMDVCIEVYDDAYSNLETSLSSLKSHDKGTLNINLSASLTDYVTCDDAIAERGSTSPVTRNNKLLREMTTNCLYLSGLIRLH
ncbi:hypothetical protein IC582_006787 [Cucumis melo]|nr:pectinesterase inhibitor 12-like [Cucumis melo]KAA0061069.1 putative pectinesterase/pectinesterase inhibitor 40 [Cucumis melo var. makuwa]